MLLMTKTVFHKIETYPANISASLDYPLFYIEFTQWDIDSVEYWRLFKRNFVCAPADQEKIILQKYGTNVDTETFQFLMQQRELHPYQLNSGQIVDERCIDMSTKSFLKFMVDALNEKHERSIIDQAPPKVETT